MTTDHDPPDQRPEADLSSSTVLAELRSTAERLAPLLGISSCQQRPELSSASCLADDNGEPFFATRSEASDRHTGEPDGRLGLMCDLCRLFGTARRPTRVDVDVARLGAAATAADRLTAGTSAYLILVDIELSCPHELALVQAILAEWELGVAVALDNRQRGTAVFSMTSVELAP